MRKLNLAVIGLGQRGYFTMRDCTLLLDSIEIVAVCDLYRDRVDEAIKLSEEKTGRTPFGTTDFTEILKMDEVEAVYIATSWESHIKIAIESMRAGKITACEVGGAYSINECYELIRTYEETKTPFMFMENACFARIELLGTAMARAGKFGTIVHCDGSYSHDLRQEISEGNIIRHYRLRNYTNRNCDNYPTHDLGPIAKVLNINRGNRIVSLVSMASKACGLEAYIKKNKLYEKDPTLKDRRFNQGDVITTLIKCYNGETITLTLDTTLPRRYDRTFTLKGTEGMFCMTTRNVFLDGMSEERPEKLDNLADFEEEFLHPAWLNMTEEDKKTGHGGVDGLMFETFVDAAINGKEMPIDVYDAATWMSISALTEQSIAGGGTIQYIPDFTDGEWLLRKPKDVLELPKGNGK